MDPGAPLKPPNRNGTAHEGRLGAGSLTPGKSALETPSKPGPDPHDLVARAYSLLADQNRAPATRGAASGRQALPALDELGGRNPVGLPVDRGLPHVVGGVADFASHHLTGATAGPAVPQRPCPDDIRNRSLESAADELGRITDELGRIVVNPFVDFGPRSTGTPAEVQEPVSRLGAATKLVPQNIVEPTVDLASPVAPDRPSDPALPRSSGQWDVLRPSSTPGSLGGLAPRPLMDTRSDLNRGADNGIRGDGRPQSAERRLQRRILSDGSECNLPIRYYDVQCLVATFLTEIDRAAPLLNGTGLHPIVQEDGKAVVVVYCIEYRVTDIGPYNEVGLTILARAPGDPVPANFVIDLPVTTAVANRAGRELWGYNKFLASIDVRSDGERFTMILRDTKSQLIATVEGNRGPSVPAPPSDILTFTMLKGHLVKTVIQVLTPYQLGRGDNLVLRVGNSGHGMTSRLRSLGLDGARPALVHYADPFQSLLFPGRPA